MSARAGLCTLAIAGMVAGPGAHATGAQFRSGASGVSVTATVVDGRKPVAGLTLDDFELTDNGVPQKLSAVSMESVPMDLTLLLDTSGSISGPALEGLNRDLAALRDLFRPDDRVRLLAFGREVREVLPMREWRLQQSGLRLPAGGATAFLQALAAALIGRSAAGRPHLIVALTDGLDNASLVTPENIVAIAKRADTVLYVVVRRIRNARIVVRPGTGWRPHDFVPLDVVTDAAESTGGRLTVVDVKEPLPALVARAISDFRSSYQIWFTPQGVSSEGWHELRLRVKRGDYTVTARHGYFGASAR